MKVIKKTKVIQNEDKTREIYCNLCSGCCYNDRYDYQSCGHEFKVYHGFRHKYDLQVHEFDLCDECYCRLIKRFKLKIKVRNVLA